MFYDKFIQLCEESSQKPTPVINKLGLSQGNLQKWKNGAVVNADIIRKVAQYFGVTSDYLLGIEKPAVHSVEQPAVTEQEVLIKQLTDKLQGMDVEMLKAVMVLLDRIEN